MGGLVCQKFTGVGGAKLSGFIFFSVPYPKEGKFSKFNFMLQILIGPVAHVRNCFRYWEPAEARTEDKIASLTELQYKIALI